MSQAARGPGLPLRRRQADQSVFCSYQLGSGEANIRSEDPVDDGEWHRLTAVR